MVSKIAVMALVAIVSCPILLGYAMNLQEETVTNYNVSGDYVNVTPLLQLGTGYSYTNATTYQLNTRFANISTTTPNILPVYEQSGTVKTSLPGRTTLLNGSYQTIDKTFSEFDRLFVQADYSSGGYLKMSIYDTSNQLVSAYSRLHTINYDESNNTLYFSLYTDNTYTVAAYYTYNVTNTGYKLVLSDVGGFTGTFYRYDVYDSSSPNYSDNRYIDISAGFRFIGNVDYHYILLPSYTRSVLITFDLSTISDSSYSIQFGHFQLDKTTVDGVPVWTVSDPDGITELYYDPSRSSNTYQLKIWTDTNTAEPEGTPGYYNYTRHFEYRYVGDWPTIIGEANYYIVYDLERTVVSSSEPNFRSFAVSGADTTPVMRVDDALFRAFEYPIIENETYDPINFKSNPSTTITGQVFGSSIEFGGHLYGVNNGKITMNGRNISLDGMTFDSVPNGDGEYNNRINGTLISTTADPSSITFNGKWGVSVSTASMEQTTTTKTQWTPGQFAWDGMDTNFLLVGMITSLAAFVGLGIYARRHGVSVIPLMIVCGGAAVLFFTMI